TEKPRNAGHHVDRQNDSPAGPAPALRLRLEPTDHDLQLKRTEDRHVPLPIVVPAPTVQKSTHRSTFVTGVMTALSVSLAMVLLVIVVQHFESVDGSSPVAAPPELTAASTASGVGAYPNAPSSIPAGDRSATNAGSQTKTIAPSKTPTTVTPKGNAYSESS